MRKKNFRVTPLSFIGTNASLSDNFVLTFRRTSNAVIDVTLNGFKLVERAPGVAVAEIISATQANLIVDGDIPEMIL